MSTEIGDEVVQEYVARELHAYDLFLRLLASSGVSIGAFALLPEGSKIGTLLPIGLVLWQMMALQYNKHILRQMRKRYPGITKID